MFLSLCFLFLLNIRSVFLNFSANYSKWEYCKIPDLILIQSDELNYCVLCFYTIIFPILNFTVKWSNFHKSSIIDTKRLVNIVLLKIISAKARDIYFKVSYLVRGTVRVKQGSIITNVISGKEIIRQIDDIRRLTTQHKTRNERFWKITGIVMLENGRMAELHWYQHSEVGKVEFKVKRLLK